MSVDISEKEQQRRRGQRQASLALDDSLRRAGVLDQSRLAYTIAELVRGTGAGRSKIYEEIAAGRLKVRKLGSRTLVLHSDAMAWLESLPAT
jgi:excisionase family DNA binding protein